MLLAAACWLAQGAAWARSSAEREVWVREAAVGARADELERALDDPDWVARAAALDAQRRRGAIGAPEGACVPARVLDLARTAGASERAAALAALAGRPEALELDDGDLESAARESPAVALALTAVLEGLPHARGVPRLAALAGHPDARVRAAAQAALAARGDAAQELAADLAELDPCAQRAAWLDGLERLERQDALAPLEEVLRALDAALARLAPEAQAEGRAGIAAVRALRGLDADARALAAGLARDGEGAGRQHALVLRAARSLRPDGGALARALLDAARASGGPDVAFDAAIEAAPRLEWLALVRDAWSDDEALAPWARLAACGERLPAGEAPGWLAPARSAALRAAVIEAAASLGEGDWLALALRDPDAQLSAAAFRALAHAVRDADAPADWLAELHRAWRALDGPERAARLRHLPRARALAPFQDDLLALGESDLRSRAACAELLGQPGAPDAVAAALRRWLEAALAELRGADGDSLAARAVAVAALRGLAARGDEAALAAVEGAARATAELDPVVAKRALALLGGSPAGLPRLRPWLGAEHPTRLRSEAALGLAGAGDERAGAVLAETYVLCDATLRARSLRAIAPLSGEGARALAVAVLRSEGESEELERLALEWFARHGPSELLIEALAGARDPERIDALLAALGRRAGAGDAPARAALAAEFERCARTPSADELEVARMESLLAALAEGGLAAGELRGDWLARPCAGAAADLRARFRGERLAAPTFRYRGEIALAGSLAARGELSTELARREDLAALDARLVAHLGLAAHGREPAAALRLLDAACVALAGEDPGEDGPAVELELRRARVDACEAAGRYDLQAHALERLVADWRGLRLDPRASEAWLGEHAPARGRDPHARLESALWQARARAAFARGEPERAREQADGARRRLGRSLEARAAQERLEAALR